MMGLDITAYRKLTAVADPHLDSDGNPVNYETEWRPGVSMEWSEKNWPGRGKGVDAKTTYTYADIFGFRAGSYGGYNQWRRDLAAFAGYTTDDAWADGITTGPFLELIKFADNEGVIGPIVAAKLAQDFAEFAERAETHNDVWFRAKYAEWRKAFEMAADGGAVDFH